VAEWKRIIRAVVPSAQGWIVDGLASAMPSIVTDFQINTVNRQAMFFSQIAEESASFQTTTEYASGSEYNCRSDLGNRCGTNDGVTYKGRGLIQLTGRANYITYGNILHQNFVGNPTLAAKFPWAARTAAEYWRQRNINQCADQNDVVCATRRVNGGTNGLSTRQMYYSRARNALAGHAGPGLRAATNSTAPASFPAWAIGVIAGVVGLLLVAAIIVIVVVARRRHMTPKDGSESLLGDRTSNHFSPLTESGTVQGIRK